MAGTINWPVAIRPLLKKYKDKKHPLNYRNIYQLVVMVVLSAQSSDEHINELAPALFKKFPKLASLGAVAPEELYPYFKGVRNFAHKAKWLTGIGKEVHQIPLTLDELTALPGIGRKSANVILREAGRPAEGIIVDLHVVRVAQRLGIVREEDPKKIELRLMDILPEKEWDAGMAMSFLGREICHPKPECEVCLMRRVCKYYKNKFN
jgi:endonuclease-3